MLCLFIVLFGIISSNAFWMKHSVLHVVLLCYNLLIVLYRRSVQYLAPCISLLRLLSPVELFYYASHVHTISHISKQILFIILSCYCNQMLLPLQSWYLLSGLLLDIYLHICSLKSSCSYNLEFQVSNWLIVAFYMITLYGCSKLWIFQESLSSFVLLIRLLEFICFLLAYRLL